MAAKAANAVMAAKTLLSFSTCSSTGGILIPVVYIGHVLDVHRSLYTLIADRSPGSSESELLLRSLSLPISLPEFRGLGLWWLERLVKLQLHQLSN
jgi:hypothetical protein